MRPCLRNCRAVGFTLVEMLVSLAIFSIMILALAAFTGQVSRVYTVAQDQNDYLLHARAMLDYIGRELRSASVAPNWTQAVSSTPSKPTLEFLIRPPANTDNFPDSLFWQAPIATDDRSHGVMAEVGYFIHWDSTNQANLCRFFVNPSDTDNYLVYTTANGGWAVSGTSPGNLQAVAPADAQNNYQGLFLENVLGLWVDASKSVNGVTNPCTSPYDSSDLSNSPHPLPSSVTVSIVVLDPSRAARLKNDPAGVASVKSLSASSATPQAFIASSALPREVQNGLTIASITVALDNAR